MSRRPGRVVGPVVVVVAVTAGGCVRQEGWREEAEPLTCDWAGAPADLVQADLVGTYTGEGAYHRSDSVLTLADDGTFTSTDVDAPDWLSGVPTMLDGSGTWTFVGDSESIGIPFVDVPLVGDTIATVELDDGEQTRTYYVSGTRQAPVLVTADAQYDGEVAPVSVGCEDWPRLVADDSSGG